MTLFLDLSWANSDSMCLPFIFADKSALLQAVVSDGGCYFCPLFLDSLGHGNLAFNLLVERFMNIRGWLLLKWVFHSIQQMFTEFSKSRYVLGIAEVKGNPYSQGNSV